MARRREDRWHVHPIVRDQVFLRYTVTRILAVQRGGRPTEYSP
jgi:hypothetical protein